MTTLTDSVTLQSAGKGKIPLVGFGTWKAEAGEVKKAVKIAVEAGVRHIDCASIYGNEKEVGEAFKEIFAEGKVKRSDLWITSKLWNTHHDVDKVEAAARQTISDLGCDYLDLYLVHWPCGFEYTGASMANSEGCPKDKDGNIKWSKTSLQQTWEAMEKLVDNKVVTHIGVSNYTLINIIDTLTYCRIKPAVNQVELHPYNTREELVQELTKFGIHVTAYSPLGSGVGQSGPLGDKTIKDIADKHKVSAGQVIISWITQQGVSAIPKSVHEERIKSNTQLVKLSGEEMKAISALNKNMCTCDMREYWGYPIHPGKTMV